MFSGYIYFIYGLIALLLILYAVAIMLYFKKYKNTKIKKIYKRTIMLITLPLCYIIIILLGFALSLSTLNNAVQGITSLIPIITSDDGCICYSKCTNNPDVDYKCNYEVLFGEQEYSKLIESLSLDANDKSALEKLATGEKKGQFIIDRLTDESVNCYQEALKLRLNFRDDDLDRSELTSYALRIDLINLLSDYKVNGRNPKCDCCNVANVTELNKECIGGNHFLFNFAWEDNWKSDDYTGDYDTYNSKLGQATGQYAITMEDGLSYYWYHQTSANCGCAHCGNWTQMYWGVSGNWHKFGTDGCAVYSLAMIVSNLIGAEITPTKLLVDLGCTISDGYCNTSSSPCFSGRNINREAAAEVIKRVYNIEYAFINSSADANDILSGDGMIWDQWRDKTYTGDWLHGTSDFFWYGGTGHFMAIRELVDNKYYCMTSCGSNGNSHYDIMNYAETPENVFKHMSGGKTIGFWVEDNQDYNEQHGGSGNINVAPEIGDTDIQKDIDAGLYTLEDYNYLVALGGESSSYNGFYAVACCVRNRVERNNSSYKIEVTKTGQFTGFHSNEVGNPRNEAVKKAAIAVLRGGESTIDDCYFFFGRKKGYDMWAEPDIDKFYNVGNNIYYNEYGKLHNQKNTKTDGAIIIYDNSSNTWKYPSGTFYTKY